MPKFVRVSTLVIVAVVASSVPVTATIVGDTVAATLTLTPRFFQQVADAVATPFAELVTSFAFTMQTNSASSDPCHKVTLNAGRWIDYVTVPTSTASIANSSKAAACVSMNVGGVELGSTAGNREMNWSARVQSTVAPRYSNSLSMWSTCFQACYGYTPYSTRTTYSSDISFNVKKGAALTAAVPFSSLVAPPSGWPLNNISGRCKSMWSQETFVTLFNTGMTKTLTSEHARVAGVLQTTLNAILANTSASGFESYTYTGSGPRFGSATSTATSLPSVAALASDVGATTSASGALFVTELTATSSSTTATPSCVSLSSCGMPVATSVTTAQFLNCTACLVSSGSTVYMALATDVQVWATSGNGGSSPNLFSTTTKQHHERGGHHHRRRRTWVREGLRQPAAPHRHGRDFVAEEEATAAESGERSYLSLSLLTQVVQLAAEDVKSYVSGIIATGGVDVPLTGAEDYCRVDHGALQWVLPSSFTVSAVSVVYDAALGGTNVTVTIPELASLNGSIPFQAGCGVALPMGTPFMHTVTGTITATMHSGQYEQRSGPSSASPGYTATAFVSDSGNVSIIETSPLNFSATKTYALKGVKSVFDPYLAEMLVNTQGGTFAHMTEEMMIGSITRSWSDRVGQLVSMFKDTATASSVAAALGGSLTLGTSSSSSSSSSSTAVPDLSDVIPETTAASGANFGTVQALAPAPPFNATCCAPDPSCSAATPFQPPLAVTAQLTDCVSCIRVSNGTAFLGTRVNMAFTTLEESSLTAQRPVTMAANHQHRPHPHRLNVPRQVTSVAKPLSSTSSLETRFFLDTNSMTRALSSVNPNVTEAFAGYVHNSMPGEPLPYMGACNVTHGFMRWAEPPQVTSEVLSVAPSANRSDAVSVTVSLAGVPHVLASTVADFGAACSSDVSTPMAYTYSKQGTASVNLTFQSTAPPTVVFDVWNSEKDGIQIEATAMTPFSITGAYGYHAPDTFLFTPYVANYFESTVTQRVHTEMVAVIEKSVWAPVVAAAADLLAGFNTPSSCTIGTYGGTHLTVSTGASCGSTLPAVYPESSSWLASGVAAYLIDAGPVPSGAKGQGSTSQSLPAGCTSAVPLQFPVNGKINLTTCGTTSVQHDGRVVLNTTGTIAFQN